MVRDGVKTVGPILQVLVKSHDKLVDGLVEVSPVGGHRNSRQHDGPSATLGDCHRLRHITGMCQGIAEAIGVNYGNTSPSTLDTNRPTPFRIVKKLLQGSPGVRI